MAQVFLNYGTSYFDLLSQRIDDNEAEIVDVGFEKLNKPDPITPNALLYVADADGNTRSSKILCQANNALQSVGCLQLPGTVVNPASVIPELSGKDATTVWLSSTNGHLYRGSVDLESSGGSDFAGPASSTDNSIVRFNGATGKIVKNSNVLIGDTGTITLPVSKYPIINSEQIIVGMDRTDKYVGYGRNGNKTNIVLIGMVNGADSNTVSSGVIVGNNSCTIGSGNQVDVIAVGNDIGTASGSYSIIVGNRVSVEPTAVSSLGTSNLVMGHDVDLRNGSLSNIILGNSSKVNGLQNVMVGEKVFAGCTSNSNTVVGYGIGYRIPFGQSANNNVLIGTNVLAAATNSCSGNILIGSNVGNTVSAVNNCLWLDETGEDGESNIIRIGKSTKTSCYINGIHSAFTPSNTQKNVKINGDGRLVATNETRPYGCHALSFSNTAVVGAGVYTFSYTSSSNLTLPIGGTPTSTFSASFFSVGPAAGSFKYTGASAVSVRYTWTFCPSMLGANNIVTFYLVKNGVVVPNTLLSSATLQQTTTTAVFVFSLVANDVIQIGYTTGAGVGGNVNVYNDTRYIEIIS